MAQMGICKSEEVDETFSCPVSFCVKAKEIYNCLVYYDSK